VYDTCPTVKVKSDVSPDGFYVINESDFDAAAHELFEAPPAPPPAPLAPPPPPGVPNPLDGLAANWKDGESAELRKIAAAVSGRAVENKAQAIAVIEAALAARG
jgi:hypothetical protein